MSAQTWPASIDERTARAIYLSGQMSGIASFLASTAAGSTTAGMFTAAQIRAGAHDIARAFVDDVARTLDADPAARHELDTMLERALTDPDDVRPGVWL